MDQNTRMIGVDFSDSDDNTMIGVAEFKDQKIMVSIGFSDPPHQHDFGDCGECSSCGIHRDPPSPGQV